MRGQLAGLVKMFTYGLLAVACLAIFAALISGMGGKMDLVGTFMPVVYICIALFALITFAKILTK